MSQNRKCIFWTDINMVHSQENQKKNLYQKYQHWTHKNRFWLIKLVNSIKVKEKTHKKKTVKFQPFCVYSRLDSFSRSLYAWARLMWNFKLISRPLDIHIYISEKIHNDIIRLYSWPKYVRTIVLFIQYLLIFKNYDILLS